MSRDQAELHHALKLLRFHGVQVIEAMTGIDLTGRMGKLVASVQGLISESFLDRLHDEIWRGMDGAISRGFSAGGRAFGYRSEPIYDPVKRDIYGNPVRMAARRVIDAAEAAAVRYIHTLYAVDGLTPRAIAHRLNREGVPTPRTPLGRHAGSWTPSTIAGSTPKANGILNNPIYTGRAVWNRTRKVRNPITGKRVVRARPLEEWRWADVPELRIVPQELWERTQARRQQRRFTAAGQTGGTRPKHLLSGLMFCAECGGRYIIQRHREGVRHYGCAVHLRSWVDRVPEREAGAPGGG